MVKTFVPWPNCGSGDSHLLKFTWWGGVLGPRLLSHVKCPDCSKKYNGKSGKDNTAGIVIYSLVAGIVAFAIKFLAVLAIAIL